MPRLVTTYADPSDWRDYAGGALERTADGERASRDTPCVCGAPLRDHSPYWPHDSASCNAFSQRPGTHRLRDEPRAKVLKLPRLAPAFDRHDLSHAKPAVIRAKLLDALRGFSLKRTAQCRSKRISSSVQVHKLGERVSLQGLATCGSVWSCPCCAARIYARRAAELSQCFDLWQSSEPTMVTLTVRHGAGDDLKTLRRGVAKAWEYLWRGRAGMARRRAWGIKHWVRALENSHGRNGWHPHIHAFVFAMNPIGDEAKRELATAWRRAVVRALGFKFRPSVRRGVDVRPRGCAKAYLAKFGLEIHAITKEGRKEGHRSPWQIAHDAARGDARSVGLWREYVAGMHGARQLTWSRGTRERFGLRELSDEDVAQEPEIHGLLAQWKGRAWDRERFSAGWLARVVAAAHSSSPVAELLALPGATSEGPPGTVRRPGDAHSGRFEARRLFPTIEPGDRKGRRRAATAGAGPPLPGVPRSMLPVESGPASLFSSARARADCGVEPER